jgi:hypothetical protein
VELVERTVASLAVLVASSRRRRRKKKKKKKKKKKVCKRERGIDSGS